MSLHASKGDMYTQLLNWHKFSDSSFCVHFLSTRKYHTCYGMLTVILVMAVSLPLHLTDGTAHQWGNFDYGCRDSHPANPFPVFPGQA